MRPSGPSSDPYGSGHMWASPHSPNRLQDLGRPWKMLVGERLSGCGSRGRPGGGKMEGGRLDALHETHQGWGSEARSCGGGRQRHGTARRIARHGRQRPRCRTDGHGVHIGFPGGRGGGPMTERELDRRAWVLLGPAPHVRPSAGLVGIEGHGERRNVDRAKRPPGMPTGREDGACRQFQGRATHTSRPFGEPCSHGRI